MSTQSDTPETDNALYPMNGVDIVWPEFARKLERERDQLKRWTSVNGVIELERERDEARKQLAEIEDRMRSELGGHPDSELWGDAGLIAATMRCVDALGEVTDERDKLKALLTMDRGVVTIARNGYVQELERQRDEARADAIRWQSIAEGRGRTNETLQPEREAENDKYIWQSVAESCGDSDETFFK